MNIRALRRRYDGMAGLEYEVSKRIYERNKKKYDSGISAGRHGYDDKTFVDAIYKRVNNVVESIKNIDPLFPFALDTEHFTLEEIVFFIEFILDLLNSTDKRVLRKMDVIEFFSTEETKVLPNNKLLSNLKKGSAEDELDELIKIMIKRGDEYFYKDTFQRDFDYNRTHYNIDSNKAKNKYMNIIRTKEPNPKVVAARSFERFKAEYCYNLSNRLNEVRKISPIQYDVQEAYYLVYEEIDVFEFIIMQFILYQIMSNDDLKHEQKISILQDIEMASSNFNGEFNTKSNKAAKQNIFYSFALYLMYLTLRNEYEEYGNVMEALISQMKEPGYTLRVPEAYKYEPCYITDMDTSMVMKYILEGEGERKDRFKKSLTDCQHMISLLDSITGRVLSAEYLQHIKVAYRELILDNLQYNSKTARTVMRKIESKDYPYFEYIKDSMFVREKISRGLYREKGFADMYELKCRIQYNLQDSLKKVFACYDEVRIARDFNSVYKRYKKIIFDVIEKI